MAIVYHEHRPDARLAHLVECLWTLRGTSPGPGYQQQILPDGCSELVLNFGDSIDRSDGDGRWMTQPRMLVAGQLFAPIELRFGAVIDLLGVRFLPHGVPGLLGVPAFRLMHRCEEVEGIAPAISRLLATTLNRPAVSRVEQLNQVLGAAVAGTGVGYDAPIAHAVARQLAAHGQLPVAQLYRHSGLGPRQFHRRFRDGVGLGCKSFARVLRFQRVLHLLDHQPAVWSAIAVRAGYSDQSHLIADFRELAGRTPGELLDHDLGLGAAFLRRNRMTDSSYR
jgi:AraC-like DNA-binding protein